MRPMDVRPDPWITDNPRLAHNVPMAMSSAHLAALGAVAAKRGVTIAGDGETPSEAEEALHVETQTAVHAALESLANDPVMKGITLDELWTALRHAG